MQQLTKYLAAIALFTASFTKIAASEPTFPPVDYLEVGKSYVFENCSVTESLNRFLCHHVGDGQLSLTDHICMECIWEVVDTDGSGGYIIQNAGTRCYLFQSDLPWSDSVYPSNEPCKVYIQNEWHSNIYPSSSITFSLSRQGSGNSYLCADAYSDVSYFSLNYYDSPNSGAFWYAYEANPDEDVILTQHMACVPQWYSFTPSFVKPVSSNTVISCSNPQGASIAINGDVYCYTAGTITITATCGDKSDTCSITILPNTSLGFSINDIYYEIDNRYFDGVSIIHPYSYNVVSIENLEIPDSIKFEGFSYPVTQIKSSAFYKHNLTGTLTLGKNLKFIDSDAFGDCDKISVVVSKSTFPPQTYGEPFSKFYDNSAMWATPWNQNAVLMVPAEAISAYSATKPWSEFKEIRSIEPLTAIAFAEPNVVCPLDGTIQLKIEKTPMYATGDISYSSSNPAVASVDEYGMVTGHSLGSTAIIAMCGTLVTSCIANVETPLPPVIPATALELEGFIANVGETVAIGAKVLPADVTDPTVNWTSSSPEVAAVDSEGTVWFNAAGSATVTAECQGLDFSVPFVVKEVMARALNVFPVEAVGGIGHEFSLLALHEPENTTDKSVTWESSDPEVATVDADGRVSLAALGSAKITARSGEHTAECSVTVDNNIVSLTEVASTGVVIDIVEGGIVVRNAPAGESIAAYAVDGKVVNGAVVESEETRLKLATGIYIVKVSPATVAKVLIK